MLVNTPYVLRADILRPRKRNPEQLRVKAHATVKIVELTAADTILVANMPCDEWWEGKKPRMDIHLWDDRFWAPVIQDKGTREATPFFDADTYQQLLEATTYTDVKTLSYVDPYDWREALDNMEQAGIVRTILSTNESEVVASLNERAAGLVIIDGVPFRQVSEPVMTVSYLREYGYHLNTEFLETARQGNYRYRADAIDEILDAIAPRLKEGDRETMEADAVRVYRPDLLRWAPERHELHRRMNSMSETLVNRLAEASIEQFGAYAALRDHLPSINPNAPEGFEEAVALARVAIAAFGRDESDLERVIDRWERTVSRDADFEAAAVAI